MHLRARNTFDKRKYVKDESENMIRIPNEVETQQLEFSDPHLFQNLLEKMGITEFELLRFNFIRNSDHTLAFVFHILSPIKCTTSSRVRERLSKSKSTTCCQMPSKGQPFSMGMANDEIGRASCRERV